MNFKTKLVCLTLALLALLLFFTSPTELAIPILITPFLLLFVSLFLILQIILERLARNSPHNARTALIVTCLPILLLALQSVGQLTLRDVLTVGLLFLVGYFYLHRASQLPN